ncbi:nucleotidyltransferase family protein [Lutibacter sp.]
MKYCSEKDIYNFFAIINDAKINYILLRNIDNELPEKLQLNKDIDLLVNEIDADKFQNLLVKNGWKQKKHPLGHFPFLYGIKPFQFYFKNGIHLDICYQLSCRSLNKGEWFPLDMVIQEDLWKNKIEIADKPWKYRLTYEDEFVHLITRCVFDKKTFNKGYTDRLEELLVLINKETVYHKFEVIFFKFSKIIFEMIEKKEYENIITNYLQYKNY